jgi:hypothetical protein
MGRAPFLRELSKINVVGCYRLQPIQALRPDDRNIDENQLGRWRPANDP